MLVFYYWQYSYNGVRLQSPTKGDPTWCTEAIGVGKQKPADKPTGNIKAALVVHFTNIHARMTTATRCEILNKRSHSIYIPVGSERSAV